MSVERVEFTPPSNVTPGCMVALILTHMATGLGQKIDQTLAEDPENLDETELFSAEVVHMGARITITVEAEDAHDDDQLSLTLEG